MSSIPVKTEALSVSIHPGGSTVAVGHRVLCLYMFICVFPMSMHWCLWDTNISFLTVFVCVCRQLASTSSSTLKFWPVFAFMTNTSPSESMMKVFVMSIKVKNKKENSSYCCSLQASSRMKWNRIGLCGQAACVGKIKPCDVCHTQSTDVTRWWRAELFDSALICCNVSGQPSQCLLTAEWHSHWTKDSHHAGGGRRPGLFSWRSLPGGGGWPARVGFVGHWLQGTSLSLLSLMQIFTLTPNVPSYVCDETRTADVLKANVRHGEGPGPLLTLHITVMVNVGGSWTLAMPYFRGCFFIFYCAFKMHMACNRE